MTKLEGWRRSVIILILGVAATLVVGSIVVALWMIFGEGFFGIVTFMIFGTIFIFMAGQIILEELED